MSGLEIERKFLVKKGDAYKSAAFSSSHIQQGYIPAEGLVVVLIVVFPCLMAPQVAPLKLT